MKKVVFYSTLLLLTFISPFLPGINAAPTPADEIEFDTLDGAIVAQMNKHGLPGVALVVVENGEIVEAPVLQPGLQRGFLYH